MPRKAASEEQYYQRIMARVQKDDAGCWLWQGAKSGGYGYIGVGGRSGAAVRVHRFVYEYHNGPVPDGLDVMHSCNMRHCVNPAHIQAATREENMQTSKEISEDKIRQIVMLSAEGCSQRDIARQLSISPGSVQYYLRKDIT